MFNKERRRLIVGSIVFAQFALSAACQVAGADPLRIDDGSGKSSTSQSDADKSNDSGEDEDAEETPQSTDPQKPKFVQEFQRGSVERKSTETASEVPTAPPPETLVIQGRIEQISDPKKDVAFPIILKKLTAKMDTRKPLVAKTQMLSGRIVSSFPIEFRGNWGGVLKVMQAQINPRCQRNPLGTYLAQNIIRPGLPGHVNFEFAGTKVILLKPSQVTFMVPASVAMGNQLLGNVKTSALEVAAMREMLGNYTVPAPFSLNLGEIRTNARGQATSFGETFQVRMMTNQIRLYGPKILEEQCLSRSDGVDPNTKRPTVDFNETVARFTLTDPDHMYVQAANVGYGSDRTFCNKVVVAGYITRGRVMPGTAGKGMRDPAKLRRLQMKLRQLPGVDAKMIDRMINQLLKQQ